MLFMCSLGVSLELKALKMYSIFAFQLAPPRDDFMFNISLIIRWIQKISGRCLCFGSESFVDEKNPLLKPLKPCLAYNRKHALACGRFNFSFIELRSARELYSLRSLCFYSPSHKLLMRKSWRWIVLPARESQIKSPFFCGLGRGRILLKLAQKPVKSHSKALTRTSTNDGGRHLEWI